MMPSTRTGYVCMYVGKYVAFKFVYIHRHCACHTVMSCVVIMWVAAASVRRKRDTNVTLKQYRFCQSLY